MVTQGANQAFMNVVLTLLDGQASEKAVLFKPYYFNHHMAITMHAGPESLLIGPSDPQTLLPDLDWLDATLSKHNSGHAANADASGGRVAMVVLTNPGNPTGVSLPESVLARAAAVTGKHGCWLILDNTYEHFCGGWYASRNGGPAAHASLQAPHVVNVFSFSKAFGMMGWRVGYTVGPTALTQELQKAQDTIAICPTAVSQAMAVRVKTTLSIYIKVALTHDHRWKQS